MTFNSCRRTAAMARATRRSSAPLFSVILMAAALGVPSVQAGEVSNIFIFGDSSSDLGSMGPDRRPTNRGSMWGETLAGRLGLDGTTASQVTLDANGDITAIVGTGGNNFAINGATAVPYPGVSSFAQQVDLFAAGPGRFSTSDLVMTWFARNDITTAYGLGVPYDPTAYADAYVEQIGRLKALGARNLVAFGTEVDLIPVQLGLDAGVPPALFDQLRDETLASEAALWPRLRDAGVYVLDLNRLAEDVRLNPGKYGFTATTDSYQGRGDPNPLASQDYENDGNVFTLDGHFTTAMQDAIADFALAQLRARDQFANVLFQTAALFGQQSGTTSGLIADAYSDRRNAGADLARLDSAWRVFGGTQVTGQNQPSDGGADADLRSSTWSAHVGADRWIDENWLVGGQVHLSRSQGDFGSSSGGLERESVLVDLYSAYEVASGLRVEAAVGLGRARLGEIERRSRLGSVAIETATGSTDATYLSARVGLAYALSQQGWTATFGGGLGYELIRLDGYRERPGVLALAYGDADMTSLLGQARVRFERDGGPGTLRPFVDLGLTHDFLTDPVTIKAGPNPTMIVGYAAGRPGRTAASIELGATYAIQDGLTLSAAASFERRFGEGVDDDTFGLRLDLRSRF